MLLIALPSLVNFEFDSTSLLVSEKFSQLSSPFFLNLLSFLMNPSVKVSLEIDFAFGVNQY